MLQPCRFLIVCCTIFCSVATANICSPDKPAPTIKVLEQLPFNYRSSDIDETDLAEFLKVTPVLPQSCLKQWQEIDTVGAANCGIFLSPLNPNILSKCSYLSHADHFRLILLAKAAQEKKIPNDIFPHPLNVFRSADENQIYVVMEKSYGSVRDYFSKKYIPDFAERYCKAQGSPCSGLIEALHGSCDIDDTLSVDFFRKFVAALKESANRFYLDLRKHMLYVNALLYLGTRCYQADLKDDNFLVKIIGSRSPNTGKELQLQANGEHIVVQIGDLGGVYCESNRTEAEGNLLDHYLGTEKPIELTRDAAKCSNLSPNAKAILNERAEFHPAAMKQGQTFLDILKSVSKEEAVKWQTLK